MGAGGWLRSSVVPNARRALSALVIVLLGGGLMIGSPSPADAVEYQWPSGWTNPTGTARWQDWNYNQCGYVTVNGQQWAHLGVDSQGYRSGPVRAVGAGVVKRVINDPAPNNGLMIEHQSNAGPFTVLYQHVNPGVGVGTSVSAGQQIGTVASWPNAGNNHVHISLIPGAYTSGTSWFGYRNCATGAGSGGGHVHPIQWLAGKTPSGGASGNGEFVSHGGHVYRIAGGAPIYVSSWNSFGGPKPTRALSDAQFSALRSVPADGTAISSSVTGRVFIVAGGSPQYVSSWSAIGGQRPTVTVDEAAVDRAVEAGVWSHLRRYPANGSYIRGAGSGRIYRVAGGAPIYVTSWAAMGGQQPTTNIDDAAIDRAGTGGSTWGHLRATPVNMFLQGAKSKRIFRVMDGHPYYVPSFAPYGGTQPFVSVDDTSIDRCDHLDCRPFGALDAAQGGAGTIRVAGWTMDPNTSDPIAVRIAVDGKVVKEVRASRSRPDVDKVYHRGSNFGFDVNVTAAAGARQVCVTAVNVGRGQDRRLGECRSTTVAQAPAIRSVKPPTVSGKARVGARLRAGSGTWEPGSVSTSYHWRVDGKTIKGATGSSLKLRKAHRGKRVTVTVTARRDGYRSVSATSARTKKVR